MFSRKSSRGYALLMDVGSGSVGLAIVAPTESAIPIWSYREHCPLKVTQSVKESSKAVVTTIMNVMMVFEGEGRVALTEHNKSAKIGTVQTTVSAPWSYTVARTVKFEKDEPFIITEQLLTQLAVTAADQAMEEFEQKHSLKDLGVQETSRTILDTQANGYRVATLNKQSAKELRVTHVSTLIREEIVSSITEMQQKLVPAAELEITSFMMANYYVTDALQPSGVDYCLLDITNEATELGIVRHNALQYSTHTAFGRTAIAREIAQATGVPLHDAFTSMRTMADQTEIHTDVKATLQAYQAQIVELFKETGDRLSIPRHIYLGADSGLGEFLAPIVDAAGKEASQGNVLVTVITADLLHTDPEALKQTDVPLTVAARFFHTKSDRAFFKYL
jgi:cell division ATPase FtsA